MRKTVIAILLVIAMLFVSCSPNATENKKSDGEETKEPTAEEFLASYFASSACERLAYEFISNKAADSEGNVIMDKVPKVALSNYFESNDNLTRYHITEATEASGTLKNRYDADNVIVKFKYYVESREDKEAGYTCNHTEADVKTGFVAFSLKESDTETETTYSTIKLNFNPYKDRDLPSLDSAEMTTFKNISYTTDKTGKTTGGSVEGVQLSDTEWAKVDAVINAVG